MLMHGDAASNKTSILVDEYIKLVNQKISTDEILVLCQSPYKRNNFIKSAKNLIDIPCVSKLNIYTFFGLCYNSIQENWPLIENIIKSPDAKIEPYLCGLEVSQQIFKNCIERFEFKGYNSKMNLLHQLFKRYTLICQNALDEAQIQKRVEILHESFAPDASSAINSYRAQTLDLRAFDYLRQLEAFTYIYKNIENPFKYVFVDDADEITPCVYEYLKHIKPSVKEFFIAYDPLGSSREGYLCAAKTDFEKFLGQKAQKVGAPRQNADLIFNSIKSETPFYIENINFETFTRRDEMVLGLVKKINTLLQSGVAPNEIAIITPNIDIGLKYFLKGIKANICALSGSEKLSKDSYILSMLILLKIINNINFTISPMALRCALIEILHMKFQNAVEISDSYATSHKFIECDDITYQKFLDIFHNKKDLKLSQQLYLLCTDFCGLKPENAKIVGRLNQLLKQITDFEDIFDAQYAKSHLLEALEYTIISENPLYSGDIDENAVILGTAQKIIDSGIKTKYQFWLDVSSQNWIKQDIGPLYNAWVFQKNWEKEEFTLSDNIELSLDKTARILRKLYLQNSAEIYAYQSVYDFSYSENLSGINRFFEIKETLQGKKAYKIEPREDQKPVLKYEKGKMAVSAVAGSGKTTIMLALIMKLLKRPEIKPENIFVLTYMESAARNFKERIKEAYPNMSELPHISTIHGLALRILRENNNYALLNLDENFEIADETRSSAIIADVVFGAGLEGDKVELYIKAIGAFKNSGQKAEKSPLFQKIFEKYENYLKENSLIDYDDLLILALKLLRENKNVQEYYQNLAHFVIEDEAQDSSSLQQELIEILGGKHNNIIRCGDVNQAITSTFSNSDVEGFKRFIKDNNPVKMNCSQRCSKGVYSLANKLIDYSISKNADAFLDVKMHPVGDKNPVDKKELATEIFDTQGSEKEFVLKEIQNIFENDKNANIGILLRSNWSVSEWACFIEGYNIKVRAKTGALLNEPVFSTVFAILKFIETPDNKNVLNCAKVLYELGLYNDYFELEKYIKNLNEPFMASARDDFPLWFDLDYFIKNSSKTIFELSLITGSNYFKKNPQKANVTIIASFIDKIFKQEKTYENTLKKLEEIAKKPNYKGVNLFEEESDEQKGVVEIMTMHKSKGDEFDYVFVPELTLNNLPLDFEKVKLKENTIFVENLKKAPKTRDELKKQTADENYRLLYVAITRSKKRLYLTSALKYKEFGKMRDREPNPVFKELLEVGL